MTVKINFPMKARTFVKCKECGGQILGSMHGVQVAYSSLPGDKWNFHAKICFREFRRKITLLNISPKLLEMLQ